MAFAQNMIKNVPYHEMWIKCAEQIFWGYVENFSISHISMEFNKNNYLFNLSSALLTWTKDYFQIYVFLNGMGIRL